MSPRPDFHNSIFKKYGFMYVYICLLLRLLFRSCKSEIWYMLQADTSSACWKANVLKMLVVRLCLIVFQVSNAELCTNTIFFFNYHFLRLEKYEDEFKLLTLELRNKSAELGRVCRKKENELGSNKNVFCCFLKMDCPYCLEKWFYSTLNLSGMPRFIFNHLYPFLW